VVIVVARVNLSAPVACRAGRTRQNAVIKHEMIAFLKIMERSLFEIASHNNVARQREQVNVILQSTMLYRALSMVGGRRSK